MMHLDRVRDTCVCECVCAFGVDVAMIFLFFTECDVCVASSDLMLSNVFGEIFGVKGEQGTNASSVML